MRVRNVHGTRSARHASVAGLLILSVRSLDPQARVEPVHYLLCEPGPEAGAAERVRDITSDAACPRPLIASAVLAFAAAAEPGTAGVSADSAAGDATAPRPAPAAAAL